MKGLAAILERVVDTGISESICIEDVRERKKVYTNAKSQIEHRRKFWDLEVKIVGNNIIIWRQNYE